MTQDFKFDMDWVELCEWRDQLEIDLMASEYIAERLAIRLELDRVDMEMEKRINGL